MKNYKIYILFLVLYWLFLAGMLIIYGYRDSFLILNRLHHPLLDYLMYGLTWFGDSLFIASLIILVFPKRTAFLIMTVLTVTLTGLLAQAMKQWVFDDCDRPLKVFEGMNLVHTVGEYRLYFHSFPSGHSVTTATAFTLLAWEMKDKRKWVILSAIMAIIVSYTRIYTGAHFAGDVLAGSIIGTVLCLGLIYLFGKKITNWVNRWKETTESRFRFAIRVIAIIGLIYSIVTYLGYL